MRASNTKSTEQTLDQAPTIVFFAVTVVGIAYIVLAKSVGVEGILVTLVPVLLMLGYAALIPLAPALRLRNDQTADNFYYMGFIFTLVSLGLSLIQYSAQGGIDLIIQNFGIAIASTITGIVLRIMFNLMRRDPMEIEHTSRLELADTARKVRREMDGVITELAHFQRTNHQMIQELFSEMRDQVTKMGEGAGAAIKDVSTAAGSSVEGAVKDLVGDYSSPQMRQQLDRSSKSMERISGRLESAAESLASSAENFSKRLTDLQTPDRIVEVSMQPAVEALQKTISESSAHQTQELAALKSEFGELVSSLKAMNGDLREVATSISEAGAKLSVQRKRRGNKRSFLFWRRSPHDPATELPSERPS